MQLLVADAGPLIALAVANVLPLAVKQFEFCVPQAVLDECLADAYAPGVQAIFKVSCKSNFSLIAASLIKPLDSAHSLGLGSGEVAVLSYAKHHTLTALIDERRARRVAQQVGVAVVGSGAVLVALKNAGLLTSISQALKAWQDHGYFLSPLVQQQLLSAAQEST